MTIAREWVKLPIGWINDDGLRRFVWKNNGSAKIAALMLLVVMAHRTEEATGIAKVTYNDLQDATGLSRTKISEGLGVLEDEGLITAVAGVRSTYLLAHYGETPWGKLPAKGLYNDGALEAFQHFNLRSPTELRALKVFLLLVARRNTSTNFAAIGYEAIKLSTGVGRNNIKRALNLLVLHGLVHLERLPRGAGRGYYNAYRIPHVEPYRHMGTMDWSDMVARETTGMPTLPA